MIFETEKNKAKYESKLSYKNRSAKVLIGRSDSDTVENKR